MCNKFTFSEISEEVIQCLHLYKNALSDIFQVFQIKKKFKAKKEKRKSNMFWVFQST